MPYLGTSCKGSLCPTGPLLFAAPLGHKPGVENRVSFYRKLRGLSQTDLAEKVGTTLNMMGKLERGDRNLDTDWLAKIGKALKVEPYMLLAPAGLPAASDNLDDIEMVGIRHADAMFGAGATFTDFIDQRSTELDVLKFPKVWVDSITYVQPELLSWVRARGRSMEPTISDGDMLLLDHSERRVEDQDDIWAFTVGDTRSIKRLRVKGDRFVILSDNPTVPDDEEPIDYVNIVARVIFIGKRT